jgi:hypothetical protein
VDRLRPWRAEPKRSSFPEFFGDRQIDRKAAGGIEMEPKRPFGVFGQTCPGKRAVDFDSAEPCQAAAEHYRAFERECLEWAKTARTEHERQFFLQMAMAWSAVSNLVERIRPLEEAIAAFFDLAKEPARFNSSIAKTMQ